MRRPTIRCYLVLLAGGVVLGCGGSAGRKVVPRTPTDAEVREAERTSLEAEAAEREAFAAPKPSAKGR